MSAEPIDLMYPPANGWTYSELSVIDLPFKWELVDGAIVVRGQTKWWHDRVRNELYSALRAARVDPYVADAERCVLFDEYTVLLPDVVVFDRTDLNVFELECTPPESVVLAVEVVSPGSRVADRFSKPGMYAEQRIPSYWRVERGDNDLPVVHEFRRDEPQGVYLPVAVHEGLLHTDLPFPVEIDLKQLVEF
ncbi:Uma2 family endonuclease [Kitasatospora sp. NPDC059795]|uniref:Uma2 family endonuclease n=1 Tax=Kitasatospora sp. NPDC059795 TaxID=3346949 RepID=UPI003669112D